MELVAVGSKIQYVLVILFTVLITKTYPYRILGGRPAQQGEYPMVAQIRQMPSNKHICGAAIVSDRVIISAAHCHLQHTYAYMIYNYRIMVGNVLTRDKHRPVNQQILEYKKLFLHESFEGMPGKHDICLIFTRIRIQFSPDVASIRMAESRPSIGTNCTVLGWGQTSNADPKLSTVLMMTNVTVLEPEYCEKRMPLFRRKYLVCAGNLAGRNDSCGGDSGGPLIYNGSQVGIVSFGPLICGQRRYPAAYTDVAYYNDWIESRIRMFSKSAGVKLFLVGQILLMDVTIFGTILSQSFYV